MNYDQIFSLSKDYVLHKADLGTTSYRLFNVREGKIFKLNKVSFAMLEAFDGTRTLADVVAAILKRFDADPARVKEDLTNMVQKWVAWGVLVETSRAPLSHTSLAEENESVKSNSTEE